MGQDDCLCHAGTFSVLSRANTSFLVSSSRFLLPLLLWMQHLQGAAHLWDAAGNPVQLSCFPYHRPQASPSRTEHRSFITSSAAVFSPCLKEEPCALVSLAFLLVGCCVTLSPRQSTSGIKHTASCLKSSLGQHSKYSIYQPQALLPQKCDWDSGNSEIS